MKRTAVAGSTLLAVFSAAISLSAEKLPEVRWPRDIVTADADRRHIERMAIDAADNLGKQPSKSDYVAVAVDPFMSKKKKGHTYLRLTFSASNQCYTVACMHPAEDSVRFFSDYMLATRKVPFASTAKYTLEDRAMAKAKAIAKAVGKVDLDDETRWALCARGFVNNNWEFNWRPLVGGYPAPGLVFVEIADTEGYDLVTFQNAVYDRPKVEAEVKIDRQQAMDLDDKYLTQHYHKQELRTLVFSTNTLEIVLPNYAFTPQDTGYEGWASPTNPPVLVWKAVYNRKHNTLERSPVQIWVDAADGSMRGGWE